MDRQYEYFAIVTDARPSLDAPQLVCRRWVGDDGQVHDEAFTMRRLDWEPSSALSRAEAGEGEVHRVDAAAARRFERLQRDRDLQMEPEDGRYSYRAWVEARWIDDPDGVIRSWTSSQGIPHEQQYVVGSGWERSYVHEDWQRGRKDGELRPIDKITADRIIERWEQRRAGQA